jgi:hypothetical protein
VVYKQHSIIFVPEDRRQLLAGWLPPLEFLWTRRTTVFPFFGSFFGLWIIYMYPVRQHCLTTVQLDLSERKCACVRAFCTRQSETRNIKFSFNF